jgi:AraC-like DNA-binding protein/ligand-binding sensor protein
LESNAIIKNNPVYARLDESLRVNITSFSTITKVPVTFYNNKGEIEWETSPDLKFCRLFKAYAANNSACRMNIASSARIALDLSEPYICSCHIGLIHIAVPLFFEGKSLGCFFAGPMIMGSLRESVIDNLIELNQLESKDLPEIIMFLKSMSVREPAEINHLANLLQSCVTSSIGGNLEYVVKSQQHKEQLKISQTIKRLKAANTPAEYPFELENQLILKTKSGDTVAAVKTLGELLNTIAALESGELDAIKIKFLGIYAVLARNIANQDPLFHDSMDLDYQDLYRLDNALTFNEFFQVASSFVEFCCNKAIVYSYDGESATLKKALKIINASFSSKINLEEIAEQIHVNTSYLSYLFKHEMGLSFTDYVNTLRVNMAKNLLIKTNLSIIDISMQSGFNDQSYFTKVFKKIESCTPKEYRSSKNPVSKI